MALIIMLSTLLQCCFVIVMQIKLMVVVILRFWRNVYISIRMLELFSGNSGKYFSHSFQHRLQKHFNNQTDDINGVTFIITCTDMSTRGTIFRYCSLEREG